MKQYQAINTELYSKWLRKRMEDDLAWWKEYNRLVKIEKEYK